MADTSFVAGIKRLNPTNYRVWSTCVMSYLQGQDLWEVTNGTETQVPRNDTGGAIGKWRVKVGRAMFVLKTTVEEEMLDHFQEAETPKNAWDILERLFTKKNDTRLQLLENELLSVTQKDMTIPKYFHIVKPLCREIADLDQQSKIGDTRMKRIIIHGLRPEFQSFVTVVQGWPTQPSLSEFENLLSGQESLAKQMASVSVSAVPKQENEALFAGKGKGRFKPNHGYNKKKPWDRSNNFNKGNRPEEQNQQEGSVDRKNWNRNKKGKRPSFKTFKCYNCGMQGHIAKYYTASATEEVNAATTQNQTEEPWDAEAHYAGIEEVHALMATVKPALNLLNDWIVDSGCSNHLTGERSG
ncbi:uncharacterized protein LOC143595303 [Bidens hawaiensis]|uniref:uncharacterized protein LOC143595303 n=1 Tax=Bidens hawaiensis TaxID=980011 RepID=UPI004049CC3D